MNTLFSRWIIASLLISIIIISVGVCLLSFLTDNKINTIISGAVFSAFALIFALLQWLLPLPSPQQISKQERIICISLLLGSLVVASIIDRDPLLRVLYGAGVTTTPTPAPNPSLITPLDFPQQWSSYGDQVSCKVQAKELAIARPKGAKDSENGAYCYFPLSQPAQAFIYEANVKRNSANAMVGLAFSDANKTNVYSFQIKANNQYLFHQDAPTDKAVEDGNFSGDSATLKVMACNHTIHLFINGRSVFQKSVDALGIQNIEYIGILGVGVQGEGSFEEVNVSAKNANFWTLADGKCPA